MFAYLDKFSSYSTLNSEKTIRAFTYRASFPILDTFDSATSYHIASMPSIYSRYSHWFREDKNKIANCSLSSISRYELDDVVLPMLSQSYDLHVCNSSSILFLCIVLKKNDKFQNFLP